MSDGVVSASAGVPDFLAHDEGDDVAVAVQDVEPGRRRAVYLSSDRETVIDVVEAIPLGHKVALTDLAQDRAVIEYGVPIGLARQAVLPGQLVHTHNLVSGRWRSTAGTDPEC
jgi:(2R)-sulfolactate sulfo-lyase subunit alpha